MVVIKGIKVCVFIAEAIIAVNLQAVKKDLGKAQEVPYFPKRLPPLAEGRARKSPFPTFGATRE